MAKKSAAQLDREISEALGSKKPQRNVTGGQRQQKLTAPQERFVALLNQRTDDARQIARDLLLEHGVIKTGRVDSVRTIGNSFSGPILQIGMAVGNSGGRIGGSDPKRFWMVGPAGGNDIPEIGGILDFMVTDGYPPTGKSTYAPKKQLHPVSWRSSTTSGGGVLTANYPESIIRKWIAKWWH